MKNYIFKGRLCGFICNDCPEPLSKLMVRIYRLRSEQNVTALAVANPKDTLAVLSDQEVSDKNKMLIAEVETDAEGRFVFDLGKQGNYNGEAFELDVYCGTVPRLKPGRVPPKPRQFSVTTIQPMWRQREEAAIAVWEYCIPTRFWCYFRGLFGAWTICGRLTTCAAPHTPLVGAKVSAFDADWLQDDPLGVAVTDASGHFRIDYNSADFKKDILGWNIELFGGPDVYFKAELGGINILNESQADGRRPGRENVGHCMCVELCSKQIQPPDVEHIPHWQQVEVFDIHPFPSASNSGFSAEGYAGGAANSFVFGGSVTLKGNCPLFNAAAPTHELEYRFMIGEWTWPGGSDDPANLPSVAPASLSPVTQITTTHIGYVFYTNALALPDSAPVYLGAGDLTAGGWIKINNKAVTVDMRNGTTSIVNISSSNFLRTFDLFVMNTPAITAAHPAKLPAGLPIVDAGRSLTTAEREPIRRYRLKFEVRDSVSLTLVASDTLDAIVLDNTPVRAALDLEELRSNACNPISAGFVHILYTVDHPHLRYFNTGISNNSGGIHPPPALPSGAFVTPPPNSNFLFRGGAGGPHTAGNNGGFAVNVQMDAPCAYRVALSWQTRHYGAQPSGLDRLYCK